MKKIICIFTLIFCFVTYLNINKSAGADAWVEQFDYTFSRVVSYHADYIHEANIYTFGSPGYSRAVGCNGETAYGNLVYTSGYRYPSTELPAIKTDIKRNVSCY